MLSVDECMRILNSNQSNHIYSRDESKSILEWVRMVCDIEFKVNSNNKEENS